MNANEKLKLLLASGKNVCLGLDPVYEKLPAHIKEQYGKDYMGAIDFFCKAIIDATHDVVAAYKPNFAFFESSGSEGIKVLEKIFSYLKTMHSNVFTIADAKRGDIDSTNEGYARFIFTLLEADAVTLHPTMGHIAMKPFLDRADKMNFILCCTSNKGAEEFQDLIVMDHAPLYSIVAKRVDAVWNYNGNCGLVTGATFPEKIAGLHKHHPSLPFLIPGIGAQGGDLEKTVKGMNGGNFLINSSRAILYASSGEDFAERAREEAIKLQASINACMETAQ